jgi:hypothetical protein
MRCTYNSGSQTFAGPGPGSRAEKLEVKSENNLL